MIQNPELGAAVIRVLASQLEEVTPDNIDDVVKQIEYFGDVRINDPAKVRIHLGNKIAYGYDFTQMFDGESAKDVYERAVANTKDIGSQGIPFFEKFDHDEVIEDRFGVYVTHI